jgi:hypothetical protein
MKKIAMILVLFVSTSKNLMAQTSITDTTAYLRDSIYNNRAFYIGKPLKVLLQNLKLNIISDIPYYNFLNNLRDTVTIREIHLSFITPLQELQMHPVISTFIVVKFVAPQKIPFKYFKQNGLLEEFSLWNINKKNYYMDNRFVVYSIKLSRKGQNWGY